MIKNELEMNQESIEQVYASMGISREVYDYAQKIWDSLKGRWEEDRKSVV